MNKIKREYIYTVTGAEDPLDARSSTRCFGWFPILREAQDAVECNRCDLREYTYDYMVIEQFYPGIFCECTQEFWYKWNYKKEKFISIDKPEAVRDVVNWGIG